MADLPRLPAFDSTIDFFREGYPFISSRCADLGTDLFETRLMLKRVVCMRGREAAKAFYGGRMTRRRAMPRSVLRLLQDEGSVQSLDGAAHAARKATFMAMMTPEAIADLDARFERAWREAMPGWSAGGRVRLCEALPPLLTRVAAGWIGLPLAAADVGRRSGELSAMIERAASVGPANWLARLRRDRSEAWLLGLVQDARAGRMLVCANSPFARLLGHDDGDGHPLDDAVVAVELLNLLRPIVAVERFITFAALMLHRHPVWRERLVDGPEDDRQAFVTEVRRLCPFFPVIAGRVREGVTVAGHDFAPGRWLMLDLYGTNRDPRLFPDPDRFDPARFIDWAGDPHAPVPQGGGDFFHDHRCPGEWATIALVRRAALLLAGGMAYEIPQQDLSIDLTRIPARVASGFVLTELRAA